MDDGRNGGVGIGRTGDIQNEIQERFMAKDPATDKRLLTTRNGKLPALHFTEFGYFNTPREAGSPKPGGGVEPPLESRNNERANNRDWQTERARADFFRAALNKARRGGVRFMVLYTATEVSPRLGTMPPFTGESFELEGKSHRREYGLLSRRGEVTGERPYGRDPAGRNFQSLQFPQRREAYCAIYNWARGRGYGTLPNACAP